MSYTPITWTDKSTLMEAEHMNAMEQALKDHDDAIEELSNSLADKQSTNLYNGTVDEILSAFLEMPNRTPESFALTGESVPFFTNGLSTSTTGIFYGMACRNGANIDLVLFNGNAAYICYGRLNSGAYTSFRQITSTSALSASATAENSAD